VRRFVAVVLAFGLVTGCATGGTGAISGTPSASPLPVSEADVPTLAPRVPAPRNARGVAACDLLTPVQEAALDVDPATEQASTQGTAIRCEWRTRDGLGVLAVTSAPDLPVGGLEGLYLVRSTYDVFEPGQLDGFPTVRADRSDSGDDYCTLYVGVADDQLIWAAAGFVASPRSACGAARQMASDMLSNLPPLR
jgi:hypothetical protein